MQSDDKLIHRIQPAPMTELNALAREIRDALHALEIRVVKLEQLVKFGGMIFVLLQLGVTIYFGLRGK